MSRLPRCTEHRHEFCVYEAGTAAGCFSAALGKHVEVEETKCCANGDPYCEFHVQVVD